MAQCRTYFLILLAAVIFFVHCKNKTERAPEKDIVVNPAKLTENTADDIHHSLDYLKAHQGWMNDSVKLYFSDLMDSLYETNQFQHIWFRNDKTIRDGT